MLSCSDLTWPSDWRLDLRKKSEMWDSYLSLSLSLLWILHFTVRVCGAIIKSPYKCWIHLTDCILCYDSPVTSLTTPPHQPTSQTLKISFSACRVFTRDQVDKVALEHFFQRHFLLFLTPRSVISAVQNC